MKQSRTVSAIEVVLNIGTGLLISTFVWMIIAPWYGYTVFFTTALGLSSIFTITSIIRSYIWRRVFVTYLDDWLHKIIHGREVPDAHA